MITGDTCYELQNCDSNARCVLCFPADYCDTLPGWCDVNAQCVYDNRLGHHVCQCNPGFQGDGRQCTFVGKLALTIVTLYKWNRIIRGWVIYDLAGFECITTSSVCPSFCPSFCHVSSLQDALQLPAPLAFNCITWSIWSLYVRTFLNGSGRWCSVNCEISCQNRPDMTCLHRVGSPLIWRQNVVRVTSWCVIIAWFLCYIVNRQWVIRLICFHILAVNANLCCPLTTVNDLLLCKPDVEHFFFWLFLRLVLNK